jgi:class 3 adenylate cyclase/tetratricopeptide (TPR) repeat protein
LKCPRCQHENRPGAKFCEECAAPLARACANCGVQLSATAKFCSECAHPAGPAAPPAPQRFGAPEAYTPKHLAERIINSKAALEGERKQVTVLFADLKGSMELADRDPEDARALLDPVLQLMMDAVHRYEGTVNQVMGDGIMALFGAPVAHEDHAVRACYTALRIQVAVKRHAEEVRRRQGVLVHVRVGLNSGEVVVRSIGSDLRMDYSAVGQTTHLASRMEQMAMPGSIVITAHTLALAEGWIQVEPLGPLPVKGLPDPIEAYELTGVGPARTRLQASAARGLTRFVGRDAELEQLRAGLEQAHQGAGQVVAVVGEPGVGKSRLFHEFIRSHRTRGWLVLESASISYGNATAYLPVLDLLRGYFRIEPRDDTRTIREKVAGKVLMLDRALEDVVLPVLALLDGLPEDSPFAALDPQQRRQLTLQALKRLVIRESRVQPLLLIFEDLHWIDSETQAFLDGLVESLPTSPVLLLVNYRPEYRHGWGGRTYYRQLRIDPLGGESAEALLASLLGDDPALLGVRRLLIQRTEGNPFFLEECVRALVETHVLVGTLGAYRLARAPADLQVPATVQAILAARIDRLDPKDKRLLQTAAVVSKDVPYPLLAAVADGGEDAVRQGLARLQTAELLYEATLFPEVEYTFKHALTHEVAYGSVLGERRRALHARIAESIERLHADRLVEHVEQLAHHTSRAQIWDKAAAYFDQAGARARARWANREAAACYEQALEALRHLPGERSQLEAAIDIHVALGLTLVPAGEFATIRRHMQEARAGAQALGDQPRLARALALLGECSRQVAEHAEAQEIGERARALALSLEDRPNESLANFHLALNYRDQGEYRRAAELLRRNRELMTAGLTPTVNAERGVAVRGIGASLGNLAWCLARLGDFDEATTIAAQEVKDAEAAGAPTRFATTCNALGSIQLFRGDTAAALVPLERGLEFCRSFEVLFLVPWLAAATGLAQARSGRLTEGIALGVEGVARGDSLRLFSSQALRVAWLGETYLLAGQVQKAREAARRGLAMARDYQERGNEADALWLSGEIAWCSDPPDLDAAEAGYRGALSIANALEMRPLVAHCHLGLGKLYRRTNKREQALEHLATATTMYREMGMTYWLEKAEAVIAELE